MPPARTGLPAATLHQCASRGSGSRCYEATCQSPATGPELTVLSLAMHRWRGSRRPSASCSRKARAPWRRRPAAAAAAGSGVQAMQQSLEVGVREGASAVFPEHLVHLPAGGRSKPSYVCGMIFPIGTGWPYMSADPCLLPMAQVAGEQWHAAPRSRSSSASESSRQAAK